MCSLSDSVCTSRVFNIYLYISRTCQVAQVVTNPPANAVRHKGCRCDPWVRKSPWRRAWQPTPVFLSGEFHGQEAWRATVPEVTRVRHDLATKTATTYGIRKLIKYFPEVDPSWFLVSLDFWVSDKMYLSSSRIIDTFVYNVHDQEDKL